MCCRWVTSTIAAVLLGVCGQAAEAFPERGPAIREDLEARLGGVHASGKGASAEPAAVSAIATVLRDRGFRPLWVTGTGLTPRGRALLGGLDEAARTHGLPSDYVPDIARKWAANPQDSGDGARIEMALSFALLRYARHVGGGRVDPERVDAEPAGGDPATPVNVLLAASHRTDIRKLLSEFAPDHPAYRRLQAALASYRDIRRAGGWPTLSGDGLLRQGEQGPAVVRLRRRLAATSDLDTTHTDGREFNSALVSAVETFQSRHGLKIDGIVGPVTRRALNRPADARIRQMRVNMERWRWLPPEPDGLHVRVNIAGAEVVIADGTTVLERMRTVVGRPDRPTPVFSDRITHVVVNPTWTVPPGIFRKDILPELRSDPGYLADHDMTLYRGWTQRADTVDPAEVDWASPGVSEIPYRVVQAPGSENPLGRIKFMFPNDHHIYLHDTPHQGLMDRAGRAQSSGCVRLARPMALADALARRQQDLSPTTFQWGVAAGETRHIRLGDPVPIHLTYHTAWVQPDGTVHFGADIYDRDVGLWIALGRRDGSVSDELEISSR